MSLYFRFFRLISVLFVVSSLSGCGGGGSDDAGSPTPTNVLAVPGDGQVTLRWGATTGATNYNVYLSSDSSLTTNNYDGLAESLRIADVSSPVTINALANGQRYYFLVTANTDEGESAASQLVNAIPQILVTAVINVTDYGSITLELSDTLAPITVANFVDYAETGFYDGTLFHRVIDGFVIQGGGFTSGMVPKATNAPITNEADNGLSNLTGTIAMARTNDPHSATSQFFINVGDNTFLDHVEETIGGWGYAVFGRVTAGMDVVNAIKVVSTGPVSGYDNAPIVEVVISSIEIAPP